MNLTISIVPNGMITQVIGGISKYLVTASELTRGRCSVDDLARFIYTGYYALWVFLDEDTKAIVGFYVTEIKSYPQSRMLCVQHCVTEPGCLEDGFSVVMQDVLTRYAKDADCTGIEFVGRLGWKKKFTKEFGYTATNAVYQMFLEGAAK